MTPTSSAFAFLQLLPLPLTQKVSRVPLSALVSSLAFASEFPYTELDFPGSQIRFATHSGMVARLQVVRTLHRHPYCSRRYFSFDGTSHLHCSFRPVLQRAFASPPSRIDRYKHPAFASSILTFIRLGYFSSLRITRRSESVSS